FGLKYPIFEAPHGPRNTSPELATAVSKAGAMGALALTNHTPESARDAVSKVRSATKGAFFINYILAFPFEIAAASLGLRWTRERQPCSSRGVCRPRTQFQRFVQP